MMDTTQPFRPRSLPTGLLALVVLLAGRPALAQCVSLTTAGSPHTQNFDTLSATAGSTTNDLTLLGWFMTESGGGARDNEQYAVDTGGSNTGDTYSYGAAATAERAFGALRSGTLVPTFGACFTNNTGATVSSLEVAYTGEQWRLGTTARTDQINFEYSTDAVSLLTGTWTGVAALTFVSPDTGTVGAKNGNAAANRTSLASTISSLSIANGSTFWIRWTDTDATTADDGLAVDDFSLTPQGAGATPTVSVNDVTQIEGDAGTTTFAFSVTLTTPAGPGGVTFDIATADGTAQDGTPIGEDTDYVGQSLTAQTIPAGSTAYLFNVTVNGNTTTEATETFFVNVTNITGATAGDVQGLGTITNDDVMITPIHDVQGPGASSPIVGSSVNTRGIVTGVKSNGFFIQEPDALVDADPNTSEGVFVFTSSAPPAAAVVGAYVQVSGTVAEFVPSSDPLQPPLTELTSPTVLQLSTGNPLPVAVPLTPTFPDPAGPFDQLERVEGMLVSVASLTVGGPTLGTVNEASATASSTGVFFGTVTGVLRAAREPGIQAPDPAPSGGTIPPIPRFDANPELLRIDSDGLTGAPLVNAGTGAVVTSLIGPLDYSFRRYTILPQPAPSLPPGVTGGPTATIVSAPTALEFTVASYNLERFYDTVNDPGSDAVLTAQAFDNRLNKASLGIRNHLRAPDILGVVEVENLTTLQALAARISADAFAASQPDPQYVAYLEEGNDIGGIDVGFLVKTAVVAGATPRVTVNAVLQENAGELFVNADSSTELLNDRPSLRLDAVVSHANGATYPVTVILNHLRSLNGVNDESAGSNGWPTVGARVRAKRQKQAESLANLVQARQTADPTERIILIGDFNAYEFNDGLVDVIGVIQGTPPPDNQTAVPGDGVDLVNPDLTNLFNTPPPGERYSFVFDGQTQNLDQVIVNAALVSTTGARRIEHPRINADFPAVDRSDATTPRRLSDHDPVVSYFEVTAFASAVSLALTKTESIDPVLAGDTLAYTITVVNGGPDPAESVSWSDTLPGNTTFVSLAAPGGWSCTAPAVGSSGTVDCSIASLGVGSAAFTLTVAVSPLAAAGSVLTNTASATTTTSQSNTNDDQATETTTVATSADLSVGVADAPDPVDAGGQVTYSITVVNTGPSAAATVSLTDPLPLGTTFVSLAVPGGWSCSTPAVGSHGTVTCTQSLLPLGLSTFSLVLAVGVEVPGGTTLQNAASLTAATFDPTSVPTATAFTTVRSPADVTGVKTVSGATHPGGTITYQIVLTNNGPSTQHDNLGDEFTDALPSQVTLVSATASSGTTSTAANLVRWNGQVPAGGSVAITITATINAGTGVFVSNQGAVSYDGDGNGVNEAVRVTDDPGVPGATDPTTFTVVALTTTTVAANATAVYSDAPQNITLTATVSGGTINEGSVTFTVKNSDGTTIGTPVTSATVSAGAAATTYVLPGGVLPQTLTITAAFGGATQYADSSDATRTLTIGKAPTTTTVADTSASGSAAAQQVILNATVAGSVVNEGTVTFTVRTAGGTVVGAAVTSGTIANGAATAAYALPGNTPPQTLTIDAVYSGGARFLASAGRGSLVTGCPAIGIAPAALAPATVASAYAAALSAAGGLAPYTYTPVGALPPWLSLSTAGVLSGTPGTPGALTFTVRATDANGCSGTQTYTVQVNPVPLTISLNTPGGASSFEVDTPFYLLTGETDAGATVVVTVTTSDEGRASMADATVRHASLEGDAHRAAFAVEVPLSAGANTVTATATNAAGQTASASVVITLNRIAYPLAEGFASADFLSFLLIANPNPAPAAATVTYLKDDGTVTTRSVAVPGLTRVTVPASVVLGSDPTAFASQVTTPAAVPLVVERSSFFNAGRAGTVSSAQAPASTSWYFAEGSRRWTFSTFLLLGNAGPSPATVTATFMTETGASVGRTYVVPATSRLTIALSSVPELADTSFGTVLTSNAPITAERALYFGAPLTGGHTSEGTPAPSTRWLLAEGATGPFFEMYLLLLNPNPTPATVRITYRTDTGATILRTRVVGPRARTTIAVRDEDPLLRSAAVWTAVDADLPIVSERSMYWPGALDSWSDGHNTVGASQPATKWGFAEGASGGPLGFDAYYLMANPGAADATVTLTFLPESGSPVVRTLTVPAGSRVTWAASQVPDLAGRGFGVVLTSTAPIVAERSMYWSAGGAPFSGGASASAVRVPR